MKKVILILFTVFLVGCTVPRPFVVEEHNVYLPIVANRYPGVELAAYVESTSDSVLQWGKPGGILGTGISRPAHTWEKSDIVYNKLEAQGFLFTIQIKNTLKEYRTHPDKVCSPPKEEYYEEYAQFVIAVLDRYDPISVSIWNEPEPAPGELPESWDNYIGCWGNPDKEYFGGEDYGKFLAVIYPIIKEAHPDIPIVGGELVFSMYNERDKKFAEGMVKYGMFDRFAFHSYPGWPYEYYYYPMVQAEFARTLTDKPLELSETSYGCQDEYFNCATPEFEQNQQEYLEYILEHAQENGIVFVRWYTLANNGWRNTDLVWKNIPRLVHKVYMEH